MFRIHIARNRQPIGEFTPEEVAEGLQSGKFLPTDLGWREPMVAWKPLSEFDNLPTVAVEPPALPEQDVVPVSSVVEGEIMPAWERRETLGIVPALYASLRQIYGEPLKTFEAMPKMGGLKGPLFFFVLLGTLGMWASMAYQATMYYMNPEAFPQAYKSFSPTVIALSQIATAIIVPGLLMIWAYIMSGIFYLILGALGGTGITFETTLRIFCYAAGAAFVMNIVPLCGFYLFAVAMVMFLVFAFRGVYGLTSWQAVVGTLLPVLMCCGLSILGSAAVIGASALK